MYKDFPTKELWRVLRYLTHLPESRRPPEWYAILAELRTRY